MKLLILFLMLGILQSTASVYSQQTKLALQFEKASLIDVFKEIEKNSEFTFLYSNEDVESTKDVTFQVTDVTVNQILDECLTGTDLTYTINDRLVVIKKGIKEKKNEKEKLPAETEQQQKEIEGKVTDKNGEGIPGVNVVVVGTTVGTITDGDGNYAFEIPLSSETLSFSFIGMVSQKVAIGNLTVININMASDISNLDEVVVVGYGTLKKSDLTGSVSSVSSKDFELQTYERIDQALRGRAAGVAVTQTSGAPGGDYKIRIRGANSLSGNNSPLYVIDGLVTADMSSVNINDISSMEVLKDASATAIYGSRGANGVVLITTKRGRQGDAKIEFETFFGVSNIVGKLDLMNAADFAEGVNFLDFDADQPPKFSQQEIDALRANGGEDWQDRIFKQANSSSYQLSASGGTDKMDYYISGNYYNADGTIVSQNFKRYSLRANVNAKLSEKMEIGLNTYLSRKESTGQRANVAVGISWDPTTPAFDEDGNYNFTTLKPGVGNAINNVLVAADHNVRETYDNQATANLYLNYNILDNLVLNISGGVQSLDREQNQYTPILVDNTGTASVLNNSNPRIQNTNRLTYTYDKNPNHRIKIDAIHEQYYSKTTWTQARASGFFTDNTTYKNLSLGSLQLTSNNSTSESLQSFLGRVNYSLFDRFLLTASMRADGSSKFQGDNRWGYFPSGSVAWRMSNEKFIQNIKAIDNLKVRASYGIIGSQGIGPLATRSIPIISPSINYPFTGEGGTIGVAPSNRLANPDLTWETTAQSNIGFDIGLWDSRLTLSFDAYKKNTTDLLLDRKLPSFTGPTVVAQNVGEVENKGFDLSLGLRILDTDDWHISSILSVSSNKNKVLALVDDEESIVMGGGYVGGLDVNPTRVEVGKPMSSFRGYLFEGVWQLGEEEEAALYGSLPGDARYLDANEDFLISTDDIITVGDGNPDFTWGWNWSAKWKNLDLNFLLLGSHGNDIYNLTRGRLMSLGGSQYHAVHVDYNNRWTPDNPSNIPTAREDGSKYLSSQFIEDGSYVTLKNVALGYTFNNVLNSVGLEALRMYVSAENLFIITDYTGFDPESTASGNSDVDLGIDANSYPLNRTFSVGLKLTF